MPLRDHFYPPLSRKTSWEGFHAAWPTMMMLQLNRDLPSQFVAEPRVHVGAEIEVDIGTLENNEPDAPLPDADGTASALAEPTVAVETELLDTSEYEVRVFDLKHDRRLVAAVEIVSPSNKDRPESRQVFVAKCQALLRKGVSVAVVDLVTAKNFNLYTDLLELIGHADADPTMSDPPATYAAACRWVPRGRKHVLETWSHTLRLGQPLPTLPIWVAENFHVPLDLEATYEQTCRALRIA